MERIDNQEPDHKRLAHKALAWVSYAFRSLSLKELQHALAVEPGDTDLDEDLLLDGQSITSLCAGLVIVDQRTNVVNLVHYTTRGYFESVRHITFPEFHAKITLVCATYLTLNSLKGAQIWEMVQKYPLACYAAQFMGDHARDSPEESLEPSILDMICNLLSHPDKRRPLLSLLDGLDLIQAGFYSEGKHTKKGDMEALLDSSIQSEMPALVDSVLELGSHEKSDTSSVASSLTITSDSATEVGGRDEDEEIWETKIKTSRIPEVTALHLAASMGLAKIASLLLKETTNIDAVDETGKTALALALERGFEKAVEFLVNSGACVDLRHEHGRSVLLLITERGWYAAGDSIVEKARIMGDKEISASVKDGIYFLLATYEDNAAEISRLVERDNLRLQAEDICIGATALFLAIEKELIHMVETLLALGVNVDSKDDLGQTSLHRATRRNSEVMMSLLLKNGASVDSKGDDYRTPWSANLRTGKTNILQILLDAGADPSTYGQQGVSELYAAAKDGDAEVVEYMLKSGTNPSIQTSYGWTPLHWASSYGHTKCVQLLLDAGVDLNPSSDQRVTPLDLAMMAEQSTSIQMLKDAGAKEFKDIEAPSWLPALDGLQKDGEWAAMADIGDDSFASLDEGKLGPDGGKLRLCYDKPLARTLKKEIAVGQYIYPIGTHGAVDNIYEVSHVLETLSNAINVRRSATRPEMWDYSRHPRHFDTEDMLYEAIRVKADYQEFELRGRQQNPLPGTLRMHKDWTGGWKIRHNVEGNTKAFLVRTTPEWSKNKEEDCRWMIKDGVLQARSGWDDGTPWICFELGVTRQMQDLIVTCWIVKLWSETAAVQRR